VEKALGSLINFSKWEGESMDKMKLIEQYTEIDYSIEDLKAIQGYLKQILPIAQKGIQQEEVSFLEKIRLKTAIELAYECANKYKNQGEILTLSQKGNDMAGIKSNKKWNYMSMKRGIRKLALDSKFATAEEIAVMTEIEVCDLILYWSYDEDFKEEIRQIKRNEQFVEDAKKSLLESVNDLKVAGFTKKQIVSLINGHIQ